VVNDYSTIRNTARPSAGPAANSVRAHDHQIRSYRLLKLIAGGHNRNQAIEEEKKDSAQSVGLDSY
jgi:hypothetical protein